MTKPTAQSDLSLGWVHKSFCWFCHAAAHFEIYVKDHWSLPNNVNKLHVINSKLHKSGCSWRLVAENNNLSQAVVTLQPDTSFASKNDIKVWSAVVFIISHRMFC